jgi:vitamin B12 transporter
MLLHGVALRSQDTVQLSDVTVKATRTELSQFGKKTERMDSLSRRQFLFNGISDLLGSNTPMFIKSGGPGALATTAFRGGSAEQTAVLWEGFNLQNAMLGQTDLTLLPVLMFDNVTVEYGGSSALWGSGAVGGSIQLSNDLRHKKGTEGLAGVSAGSMGQRNAVARVRFSEGRKWESTTRGYYTYSANSYSYNSPGDEQIIKQDAPYAMRSVMQQVSYAPNGSHQFAMNGWLSDNARRLPSFSTGREMKSWQDDQALRMNLAWKYSSGRYRSEARAAFFSEQIDFNDSIARVYSRNKVRTAIAEQLNYITMRRSQLHFGAHFTVNTVRSNNYASTESLSRFAVLFADRVFLVKDRLQMLVTGRAEYFSAGRLPVTGSMALEYLPWRRMKLALNGARIYRQPTMNELYWTPGGNRKLKPEEGYTAEGVVTYSLPAHPKYRVEIGGAAFSRIIDNWVLWVPGGGGNPTPINLQKVWSRGTETTWNAEFHGKDLRIGIRLVTGYVLATVSNSSQMNSDVIGRQLVHTPRYTAAGRFFASLRNTTLVFYYNYAGYRFSASDNSAWLEPYAQTLLRLNQVFVMKRIRATLFATCNNLLNQSYAILPGRSMPLRNFEAGLTIDFKSNN